MLFSLQNNLLLQDFFTFFLNNPFNCKVLDQIVIQMNESDRQEIRKNRQRIRKNIMGCFVTPQLNGKKQLYDLRTAVQETITKKLRRKTSLDIKELDCLDFLRQIYISNSFDDLYQKIKYLGQGSQSVVYSCQQLQTKQIFAVKITRSKDPEMIQRFKEQYRLLKTLQHENIIKAQYLFVNQIQGTIHMVLQYCSYPNLTQYLRDQILTQFQAANILQQLFLALQQIHSQNICHRDIKPDNILYNSKTGQLKIIDFQISKMARYLNKKVQMCTETSSIHYKAPEMFCGGFYNQLIDIWAVGVILYSMLTGKLPFFTQYQQDLIELISKKQPDYSCPNLTKIGISFLQKLLCKNPLERLTAKEALKHPFMLRFSSASSSSSPKLRKNGSNEDKKEERPFELNVQKCLNQNDQINGKLSLPNDIGIRFYGKKQDY